MSSGVGCRSSAAGWRCECGGRAGGTPAHRTGPGGALRLPSLATRAPRTVKSIQLTTGGSARRHQSPATDRLAGRRHSGRPAPRRTSPGSPAHQRCLDATGARRCSANRVPTAAEASTRAGLRVALVASAYAAVDFGCRWPVALSHAVDDQAHRPGYPRDGAGRFTSAVAGPISLRTQGGARGNAQRLGVRRGAPWVGILSAFGLLAALSAAALRLESVEEGVEAGGEPFVAVVEPDVFAEGDEGGEAVGR